MRPGFVSGFNRTNDERSQESEGDLVQRGGIRFDRDRVVCFVVSGAAHVSSGCSPGAGALGQLPRLLLCVLRDSTPRGFEFSFLWIGIVSRVCVAQAEGLTIRGRKMFSNGLTLKFNLNHPSIKV